jgi:signal transduction histidine kinase
MPVGFPLGVLYVIPVSFTTKASHRAWSPEVKQQGNSIEIAVSDNGPGIAEQEVQRF